MGPAALGAVSGAVCAVGTLLCDERGASCSSLGAAARGGLPHAARQTERQPSRRNVEELRAMQPASILGGMTSTQKSALVLLAPGAEEMETVISVDVLRRAGVRVVVAGVDGAGPVACSRGVQLVPDTALSDVTDLFDAVVLPGGGPGARHLAESERVGKVLARHWEAGKLVAAICAAPLALLKHEIALGSRLSHYPGLEAELSEKFVVSSERVTRDGNLLTAQGPGVTFEFALALVERLCGPAVAEQTRGPLLLSP